MAKSNLDRICGVFQVTNSFRSPRVCWACGLVYRTPLGRDPIVEILRPRETGPLVPCELVPCRSGSARFDPPFLALVGV
jgi:hypothetical protein